MTITKFETLFSSKDIEWETPIELFNQLNEEFHFTLDPCCTKENAKCSKFYTKEDDGLSKSWDNEVVFVNPPYGKEISKWCKKSSETRGIVVMLLPARTDTKYFHDYIYHKAELRFIKGRLKFGGNQNGSGSAPFPSMIVIFNYYGQKCKCGHTMKEHQSTFNCDYCECSKFIKKELEQ